MVSCVRELTTLGRSRLQCAAVCCSALHCAAACCSVLQCVAVCCSVLQYIAVCCSVYHTYLAVDLAWSALQEGLQQHAGGCH